MNFDLATIKRDQTHRFLATQGLYFFDNLIWRIAGPPVPLAPPAVMAVQLLWDAEWDRIKLDIEPLFKKQEEEAAAAAARRAEAERRNAEAEELRKARIKANIGRRAKAEVLPEGWSIEPSLLREGGSRIHIDAGVEARRIHRNRPRFGPDYPEAAGGLSEHHLYGPRGFKNPFKYEETGENWALPTIFPKGHIGGQLHYRPERPLADDRRLSIVTADICGDPPKGRSALEARATLHA